MTTVTHDIVAKLWNLCNVLKDDGVTYHQYVTELTYLLFLKMAKETGTEDQIPQGLPLGRSREAKPAPDRLEHYKLTLIHLGSQRLDAGARRSSATPALSSRSRRRSPPSSPRSTSSTGTARARRDWATSTRACWRRTRTRRSRAPASTSRRAG
jgi:hypothetical protein